MADWHVGPELPPDGGWSSPDPEYGPELQDWPDPPGATGPGPALVPDDWSGTEAGFSPPGGPAADDWTDADDGSAVPEADEWAAAEAEAGLRPGAVLGQGEWVVREPDAEPVSEAEPASGGWADVDQESPPATGPALNLWPTPDTAPPAAEPAPAASEGAAEGGESDDEPVHRVESEFNVWQVPARAAEPDADSEVDAEPAATPATADEDEPASPGSTTGEWVQITAARLRDADLLPDADLAPDADLRPDADVLPIRSDDEMDPDSIRRPPAPRRSGPAPGWNPDSEEDWLRVLRGLRASEDG